MSTGFFNEPSASRWSDSESLTVDKMRELVGSIAKAPPPLRFMVVPSWVSGYRWVDGGPCRRPPPRADRKGTRRQWKLRNNRNSGWRRRWVYVEPDHMMTTRDGTTFCTEMQWRTLLARVPEAVRA